jgi:hypothetical protein
MTADIQIKSEAELRHAIVVLGLSLSAPVVRKGFWRYDEEAQQRAWMAFCALGWAVGAENSVFDDLMAILEPRLRAFGFPIPELRGETNG